MTGSQQEEVIERITEEESWKKRRRKHGQRQRQLEGKREKKCRMNEHAHSVFTASPRKYLRQNKERFCTKFF